jgi:hypothetical protein
MVAQIFVSPILALIPAMMGGVVWLMYRTKVEWAYWFAPIVMALVSGLFCILLFLNVQSILLGNVGTGAFLMTILIGWATFSSIRFIRIHFHPVYKMGYSGHSVYDEGIQLEANEMLAACPTCLAVLAVNPLLLSPDDSCPHCGSPLVTKDSEEE